MRMRPTHGAAVVFAATHAATVASSGPAEAFFFLPMFQSQQPSFESRSGRSPSDNTRWKRGRGTDEGAEPAKPSGGTRAKRDEEKSNFGSSGKSGKSQAKSESSSSQASRTRSVRQEPPPSKSSGRASASVRRESPAGGGSTPPPTPPAQTSDTSAQASSPARAGSTLGDTFDEKLGEVFKARIDAVLKQAN